MMDKVVIDAKIEKLLAVKGQLKELKTLEAALQKELDGLYEKDASEKETIYGKVYMMEKVPVNNGAHKYDVNAVASAIEALDKKVSRGIVKTVKQVDAAKFEALAKDGYLPDAMVDAARMNKYTFKSQYKMISAE